MNSNISIDSLFANNPHINFTRNLNLIPNYVPGYQRLFKNCAGLLTAPILRFRPLSDWFYQEIFMNCNAEISVTFDSCFQPGLDNNNGEFTNWLYNEKVSYGGTINICSVELFNLLNTNEVARNMMIPENWDYVFNDHLG